MHKMNRLKLVVCVERTLITFVKKKLVDANPRSDQRLRSEVLAATNQLLQFCQLNIFKMVFLFMVVLIWVILYLGHQSHNHNGSNQHHHDVHNQHHQHHHHLLGQLPQARCCSWTPHTYPLTVVAPWTKTGFFLFSDCTTQNILYWQSREC